MMYTLTNLKEITGDRVTWTKFLCDKTFKQGFKRVIEDNAVYYETLYSKEEIKEIFQKFKLSLVKKMGPNVAVEIKMKYNYFYNNNL